VDAIRVRGAELAAAARAAAAAAAQQDALDAMYQQGLFDGRTEGEAAEQARLRTAVHATARALDELRAGELHWTQHLEENLAALGVAIAQQIIGRETTLAPDVVHGIVRRALDEFPIDQPLVVRLHPTDCALAQVNDGARSDADAAPRFVPDPRVQPGGCLVEGRDRIVDGRVDTALERVYRRLTYTNA
jgi:flagellar assembly protein FliH